MKKLLTICVAVLTIALFYLFFIFIICLVFDLVPFKCTIRPIYPCLLSCHQQFVCATVVFTFFSHLDHRFQHTFHSFYASHESVIFFVSHHHIACSPNILWQKKNHLKYSTHSRYWFCYFLLWFQDGFGYKWYIHCLTASNMNCLSYFICSLRSHGTKNKSLFFIYFSLFFF